MAEVLERLDAVGLVDDIEFARAFIAGRRARRRRERAASSRSCASGHRAEASSPRPPARAAQGGVDELATARKVIAQAARRYGARAAGAPAAALRPARAPRHHGDIIRRALALPEEAGAEE